MVYLLTALSLVLFVSTAALWVRSYIVTDQFVRWSISEADRYGWIDWAEKVVEVGRGGIGIARIAGTDGSGESEIDILRRSSLKPFHETFTPPVYPAFESATPVLGFRLDSFRVNESGRRATGLEVTVPLWCPCLVFLALPVVRAWHWRKRRNLRLAGHCRGCGYDLRATPGRCPECGEITAAPARIESV